MGMSKKDRDKDIEERTEASLASIRRDLERKIDQMSSELKEKGPQAVQSVEESLNALKEDLEKRLSNINESLDDKLEAGRNEIRKKPLMAVGIALLVGLAAGMLLGRKCKD